VLLLAVMAEAWAQKNDGASPESADFLQQIKFRVTEDLAGVPNYICVSRAEWPVQWDGQRVLGVNAGRLDPASWRRFWKRGSQRVRHE
jgi:hypothetical protein